MDRLLQRFSGLRWRLMLSFFVAAWAAMVTLELLFVAAPAALDLVTPQRPVVLAHDLQRLTPQLAPYLATTSPDRTRLTALLATFKQPILIQEGITDNLRGSASVVPGENAALFVVRQDGAVIAALPAQGSSASGLAHIQDTSEARTVIAAALHNSSSIADMVQTTSGGQTLAAAPIRDASGSVRGALLLGVDLAALTRPIYLSGLVALIPSTVLFGVIASVFGAVFGLLTARGLTRRLRRLTTAAGAWSQGDFATSAQDPSPDELGQLARDLNRMAEQIQSLLHDRQQLAVVDERNRLARDLHDSVKQQLFALTMLLGSARMDVADQPEARRILDDAERIAGSAQQELTALISALRPVGLANKGLSVALRELCENWPNAAALSAMRRFLMAWRWRLPLNRTSFAPYRRRSPTSHATAARRMWRCAPSACRRHWSWASATMDTASMSFRRTRAGWDCAACASASKVWTVRCRSPVQPVARSSRFVFRSRSARRPRPDPQEPLRTPQPRPIR
jgi:two-component system, NarL family, sensor histidine kinase LiaS